MASTPRSRKPPEPSKEAKTSKASSKASSKAKAPARANVWQNRIVEHGSAPANQFLAHELNARRHPGQQRESLRGSLNEVGWIAPVIVSARTGKLLDGHARIEEALSVDEHEQVPFIKVDVSEGEERLILASFDPITNQAYYDKEALDALLREVSTGEAGLTALLAELAEKNSIVDLSQVEFKEYDESIADEVKYHECPKCGHKWPQ